MKTSSFCALWLFSALSCVVPSGCSKNYGKGEEKAKELHLYMQADITSLDPRVGYDRRAVQINRELFEGLMRIGKNGTPEPALARSVILSDDKTVYTFHLHLLNGRTAVTSLPTTSYGHGGVSSTTPRRQQARMLYL